MFQVNWQKIFMRSEGAMRRVPVIFDLTERTELFKFKFRFEIAENSALPFYGTNFARGARGNTTSPFLCRAGRFLGKDGEMS